MEQDYKMASKNMENFKKYLKEQGLRNNEKRLTKK